MATPPKFSISDTIQSLRTAFERDRSLVIRTTVLFAVLSALASLLEFILGGGVGLALSTGIFVLLSAAYSGMITALVCLPGKAETMGELWSAVRPVLARLIWLALTVVVGVFVGIIALILPAFAIATLWSVGAQVVVVERRTVFKSLDRSFALVSQQPWRVFGYLIVLGIFFLVASGLSMLVTVPLGTGAVGTVVGGFIGNLISQPVLGLGTAVLYSSLVALEAARKLEDQTELE